jgi:hypothetical protein
LDGLSSDYRSTARQSQAIRYLAEQHNKISHSSFAVLGWQSSNRGPISVCRHVPDSEHHLYGHQLRITPTERMEPNSTLRNHVISSRSNWDFRIHIPAIGVLVRWSQQHLAMAHELVSLDLLGPPSVGCSNLHGAGPSTFAHLACQIQTNWNVFHGVRQAILDLGHCRYPVRGCSLLRKRSVHQKQALRDFHIDRFNVLFSLILDGPLDATNFQRNRHYDIERLKEIATL